MFFRSTLTKPVAGWPTGFLWLTLWACQPANEPAVPPAGPSDAALVAGARLTSDVLVSATPVGTYTAERSAVEASTVRAFRLVYRTRNVNGAVIQASGLLLVPSRTGAAPLLSLQHYTIDFDWQAPSYYLPGTEGYTTGNRFAAEGYIVAAPDYIGYGASRSVQHPYEHRSSLASASLDMLRAARQFIQTNGVRWNGRVYIEGFSEGAYATLALQKLLQDEAPTEFSVVASSCGSGAHDKPAFMRHLLNNKTSGNPAYNSKYIWVLLTYNRVYGLNRPMSYYFKEPYATQIERLGKNAVIPVSLNLTFTDGFRRGVNDGTDVAFLRAVADNDLHDWRPVVRERLYHGTADALVPYFNAQNTFEAQTRRGASAVELVPQAGRAHENAMDGFLDGTSRYFRALW